MVKDKIIKSLAMFVCALLVSCANTSVQNSNKLSATWDAREGLLDPMTRWLPDYWRVQCNADWNQDCNINETLNVPKNVDDAGINSSCPPDIIGCLSDINRVRTARSYDLCSFTYAEEHADGGTGWPIGADSRHVYFHVESSGSHNIIDRRGGDASYLISLRLIDTEASDAQRIEKGCTRPGGKCECRDLNGSMTFFTRDACDALDCNLACSRLSTNERTIGMKDFKPGTGAPICPIR